MRILLDDCVPTRLRRYLLGHEVRTVVEQGWSGITNGKLLALVQAEFDVLLTVDANLRHQQHVPQFDICLVSVRAHSNTLGLIEPLVPNILAALAGVQPGIVITVDGRQV